MSSCFIFNNFGVIDEVSLEDLHLVINFANKINCKQYVPSFFWVLRDFSLDLKDKTPKEYLQKSLEKNESYSKAYSEKNSLNKFFNKWDWFCLIRPINDESKLRNIEKLEFNDLRDKFKQQSKILIKKIFENNEVKLLNKKPLDSKLFIKFIKNIIDNFNNKEIPEINTAIIQLIKNEENIKKEKILKNIKNYISNNDFENISKLKENITENTVNWIKKYFGKNENNLDVFNELLPQLKKLVIEESNFNKLEFNNKIIKDFQNNLNEKKTMEEIEEYVNEYFKNIDINLLEEYSLKSLFGIITKKFNYFIKENENEKEKIKNLLKDENNYLSEKNTIYQKNSNVLKNELKKLQEQNSELVLKLNLKSKFINNLESSNNKNEYIDKINNLEEMLLIKDKEIDDLKYNKMVLSSPKDIIKNNISHFNFEDIKELDNSKSLESLLVLIKEELVNENNELNDKCEYIIKENDKLKRTIMDLKKNNSEFNKNDNNSNIENNSNLETIDNLKFEIAKANSENVKMKSYKENFFYLLKETLKSVKKKKNNLNNALNLLEEEDEKEFYNIVSVLKIKLK